MVTGDGLYTLALPGYTDGMIYDVTLPITPGMAVWPGDPLVSCESLGEQVRVSRWTLGSHSGTHVDAPRHFSLGASVDQLNPATLLGACRVLHLPGVPLVTAEVLKPHALAGIERLLLRTDNSRRWAQATSTFFPDFVGLDAGAAQLLRAQGVKLVGCDGFSIEPYDSTGDVHQILLGAGVVVVEMLNLAAVPPGDYQLICAPLLLAGADGAPARVLLIGQ